MRALYVGARSKAFEMRAHARFIYSDGGHLQSVSVCVERGVIKTRINCEQRETRRAYAYTTFDIIRVWMDVHIFAGRRRI